MNFQMNSVKTEKSRVKDDEVCGALVVLGDTKMVIKEALNHGSGMCLTVA